MAAIKLNPHRSLRREATRRSNDCAVDPPRISNRIPRLVRASKAIAKRANKRDQAVIALTRAWAKPRYHLASRKPSSQQKRWPYSWAARLARTFILLTRYQVSNIPFLLRARLIVTQSWWGELS